MSFKPLLLSNTRKEFEENAKLCWEFCLGAPGIVLSGSCRGLHLGDGIGAANAIYYLPIANSKHGALSGLARAYWIIPWIASVYGEQLFR